MKNKKIIILIIASVLVVGIILFLIFYRRTVSTITLDINPSIKVNLDKNDKVINVKAVNSDAKKLLSSEYNNKTIEEFFDLFASNAVKNGLISNENNIDVIIYADGNINVNDLPPMLEASFSNEGVHLDLMVIEEITKEDIELAKKQNVNPAKVSYIRSIIKDSEGVSIDDLSDRPISELKDVEALGLYCDEGYRLDGTWCIKEISSEAASSGMVCPDRYEEIDGKCYKSEPILEKEGEYVCDEGTKKEGNKCIMVSELEAEPVKYACNSGKLMMYSDVMNTPSEAGDNRPICVNDDSIIYPSSACVFKIDGKCYHGPSKPTIDGKCLNTDVMRDGRCYELKNYEWVCPDGRIKDSQSEVCGIQNYTDAYVSEYKCPDDRKLEGDKCVMYEYRDARPYRYCASGYTMIGESKCVDYNNTAEKSSGYYCEGENTKLDGNRCITFISSEAKSY